MDLLSILKTYKNAQTFKNSLGSVQHHLRGGSNKVIPVLEREMGDMYPILKQLSAQDNVNMDDATALDSFLNYLMSEVSDIQSLELTLGFKPSEVAQDKILEWLRKEVTAKTLPIYEYSPEIVGGAQLSFGGRYFDGSLNKKLTSIFANMKGLE